MTTEGPLVSICCTTYNHELYIRQALDGFLDQVVSFRIEILINDDASTDGTAQIIKEYEEKYPELIKPLYQLENQYSKEIKLMNVRFNFPRAKGKYIALCEGDDYWTDSLKLQKQVDFLEDNTDFGICFHNVEVVLQAENKFIEDAITREVPEITTIRELAMGNFIHTPSVLFRNDFKLPKWFLKTPLGDWSLYMTIIKNRKIKKLQDKMAIYRLHEGGSWSERSQEERDEITLKAVKLIYKNLDMEEPTKQVILNRLIDPRSKSFKAKKFLGDLKKLFKL